MRITSKMLENQATELHALVAQIGLSQREIASRLGVGKRDFRRYVAGRLFCPMVVRLALEKLAEQKALPQAG